MTARYRPDKANHKPIGERIMQHLWYYVQAIGFRGSPFFARRWRMLLFRLFGGKIVGKGKVSLSRTCTIGNPWNVTIGVGSFVGDCADLRASTTLSIGTDVCISAGVKIHGASHDINSPTFDYCVKPVSIGNSVWIAEDAIILSGLTIGEGAVIGAGAVVTRDVEPWSVVAGNPARMIRMRVLKECRSEM